MDAVLKIVEASLVALAALFGSDVVSAITGGQSIEDAIEAARRAARSVPLGEDDAERAAFDARLARGGGDSRPLGERATEPPAAAYWLIERTDLSVPQWAVTTHLSGGGAAIRKWVDSVHEATRYTYRHEAESDLLATLRRDAPAGRLLVPMYVTEHEDTEPPATPYGDDS